MSAFVAQDANRPDAIAGVVSLGGVPAMAASLAIRPSTVKAPSQFALVLADKLDPAAIAALGKEYGISDLKIDRATGPGIALMDPLQRPSSFTVSWVSSANGRQLFNNVLPAILLVSAIAAVAFAAVALTWWRFVSHLKESEQRVLAAELEASRAETRAA